MGPTWVQNPSKMVPGGVLKFLPVFGLGRSWGGLGGLLGASWGPLGGHFGSFCEACGGFWGQNWSRTSSWTVSVFREDLLGGVLGSFFKFLEVVLDLILRVFRGPCAQ